MASDDRMEQGYWSERWQKGQIGFHEGGVNRHLRAQGAVLSAATTRVLVPLCGKSRDLAWLRAQGHEVVGVEFVPAAAEAFFAEGGLAAARTQVGPHPAFSADGVTIVVADFLALDPALVGRFPAAWDRAALVALPSEQSTAYLGRLRSLVSDDARVLLVTFDHDLGKGPPFSVPEADLRRQAAPFFSCEQLARHDVLAEEPRFRERGATRMDEQVFLLRPRP